MKKHKNRLVTFAVLATMMSGILIGPSGFAADEPAKPAVKPNTDPAKPKGKPKNPAVAKPAENKTPAFNSKAAAKVETSKPVPPTGPEEDYFKIIPIPIPVELVMEVTGLEVLPDGNIIAGTRRGDIYLVENSYTDPADKVKFTRWATGLHEITGLAQRDGWVYACQRGEITRLKDSNKSGKADTYETFYDGWGIKGDYHEYPMMSHFDKDGNLYVALCLTGSRGSDSPFRGWMFKITPDGKGIPYASGVRSPGTVGFNHLGDVFYTDNQGFWNGMDNFKHAAYGSFTGNPVGNNWYDEALKLNPDFGPKPPEPASPSRWHIEAAKHPALIPPPIMLPYRKMGQSASGMLCDLSDGKFGPFKNQLFIADQSHSNVARGNLEKINGKYQGWAVPFRKGFGSGIVPMVQAKDGSWFVGGSNRGWGSIGTKPFALDRLVWTGKTPFEMLDMHVLSDGFELTFTQPVHKDYALDYDGYDLSTYTCIYQSTYGSPEVDLTRPTIKNIAISPDGLKVKLTIDGLVVGSVHELHMNGLRAADDVKKQILHPVVYYTMWNVPGK